MSYTICITPSCAICQEILIKLKEMKIDIKIKNLEIDNDCEVSIFPALFHGEKLIAYGKDILTHFKRKKRSKESVDYS